MKLLALPVQPVRHRHVTTAGLLLIVTLLLLLPGRVSATVPLPDQVIYGTIAIQNKAVTNSAANTNVVIEARRASDNYLLASYRMGTSTSQGKLFYLLRVPMEDAPTSSQEFAEPSDQLVLIVKKSNIAQFTSTNMPIDSGTALRIDFGSSVDTDGDGVPDGWEITYFGSTGRNLAGDSDHDGISDLAEYIAGTSPMNSNDVFQVEADLATNQMMHVSFHANAASGVGYEGKTRYYGLEFRTNLTSSAWSSVTNYSRVRGTNQTVAYDAPTTNGSPMQFYRARVWLE